MTFAETIDASDVRRRGREAQTIALILLVLAAVSVVGDILVGPLLRLARSGHGLAPFATDVRDNAIAALPMIILLGALWSAHRVFGRVADGDVFSAANAAGLGAIGQAMGWSGFAAVVMAPTLQAWVARRGGFDVALEGWALVLAALGGAVVLFGRIWALAIEIKTDADQII
ncbi:MAG: DUF2975 domain-containing protein [Hyphomonadaceae bacterium]|nr:DUF2975 domain-containing protein [Hyphomonadaceae bacterium]